MSVVTGDDLVPRLSLVTLELLKNQLVAELHSCRHPKVRISCLFKACTIVPIRFTRSDGSVFFFFVGCLYELRIDFRLDRLAGTDVIRFSIASSCAAVGR